MDILRPIVSSTIIDNNNYTFVQGSFEDVVLGVITSDKGRDSKFLEFTSPSELLNEFTVDLKPNDKVHGQAILDVLQAMEAGAVGRVMRVVPDNATLPNGLVAFQANATAFGLDVTSIVTPDEIEPADGTAKDIVVTLSNSTPFSLVTIAKLYKKSDVQSLIDFYNGDKSADEIDALTLPTAIAESAETTVAANDTGSVTFNVTGTQLGLALAGDSTEVVIVLEDSSEKVGYVSKMPALGGTVTASAAPAVDTTDTTLTPKKLLIKPVVISRQGLTSKDDFESLVNSLTVTKEDIGGDAYSALRPIFGFVSKSKNADEYSIQLTRSSGFDNTYSFRTYELTVLKKDSKGNFQVVTNGGPFLVSLSPDALDEAGTSLFIKDVLDTYFDELDFYFNEAEYAKFIDDLDTAIKSVMGAESTLNPELVDVFYNSIYENSTEDKVYRPLTYRTNIVSDKEDLDVATAVANFTEGQEVTKSTVVFNVYHYSVEKLVTVGTIASPTLLDVASPSFSYVTNQYNYKLTNGSTGSWASDTERITKIASAYQGLIDPDILNKKLTPVDLVFDSNQHATIRNAIRDFVASRGDCFAFIGAGVNDTKMYPVKISSFLGNYSYDSYRIALFTQHFTEVNKYTGKRIKVSSTYHLAKKIVSNDIRFGTFKAIAGKNYGVVGSADMSISFVPNDLQQEELYKNRVNYFIKDRENTRIATQLTTQSKKSPLSDIPTVRELLKTIRQVENIAEFYQYEDLEQQTTIEQLEGAIKNKLDERVLASAYSSAKVTLYSNEYDKVRKKQRVRIELTSPKFLEQIILDWVIN